MAAGGVASFLEELEYLRNAIHKVTLRTGSICNKKRKLLEAIETLTITYSGEDCSPSIFNAGEILCNYCFLSLTSL
jgi:hypothetical protein